MTGFLGFLAMLALGAGCGAMPQDAGHDVTSPSTGGRIGHPTPEDPERPNVLVVVLDDIGLDGFACYGLPGISTAPQPTMQALCTQGVLFDRAWANPLCSATRAGMLTGRYANRHGVGQAIDEGDAGLSEDETILPAALDAAGRGYATAAFGKWHLTPVRDEDDFEHPNRMGFDHYAGFMGGSVTDYDNWPRVEDGEVALSSTYATTQTVDDALTWVREQDDPWFMWVAFNAAHTPYHVPPAGLHGYDDLVDDPGYMERFPLRYYQAMIESVDTELGRLLRGIRRDVMDNTWIIVVGDNGAAGAVNQDAYPEGHDKSTLYQGGILVPLLVVGPDVDRPGRRETAMVSTVDLFSTVLELTGADPAEAVPAGTTLDSVSMVPYLVDRTAPDQRSFTVTEAFGTHVEGGLGGQAISDGRFKYLRLLDGEQELYDLRLDPFESVNLLEASPSGRTWAAYDAMVATLDTMPLPLTGGEDDDDEGIPGGE